MIEDIQGTVPEVRISENILEVARFFVDFFRMVAE